MPRYLKTIILSLSFLSVFFSVVIAINVSRMLSRADNNVPPAGTQVILDCSSPAGKATDTLQMKHCNFITLTPAVEKGDSGGGGGAPPPPPVAGGAPGTPHWPFKDKSPSQFNRIDGGWDLRYKSPTEVLAMTSGTVYHQKTLSHANGGGFGPDWPVVKLDTPVTTNVSGKPRTFTHIYYGHVHIIPGLDGKHVNAGDPIAKTDPSGNPPGVSPNWLEVGFDSGTGNPLGGSGAGSPIGFAMCEWLHGAKCPSGPNGKL